MVDPKTASFNPSQVGYKPFFPFLCFAIHARFNPSQVGYKPARLITAYQPALRFNPSQVGYKPARQDLQPDHIPRSFNPSQVGYKPTRLLRVGPQNEFKTVPIVKVRALPVGGFIIPHRCG